MDFNKAKKINSEGAIKNLRRNYEENNHCLAFLTNLGGL